MKRLQSRGSAQSSRMKPQRAGQQRRDKEPGMDDVIIVLFVGITEESVFRGWLLNATLDRLGRWRALIVNSLLFLAIHFPKWIVSDEFLYAFTSFGFAEVIALSLLFGWSFLRTRNLLLSIALHMFYDLVVMMFV